MKIFASRGMRFQGCDGGGSGLRRHRHSKVRRADPSRNAEGWRWGLARNRGKEGGLDPGQKRRRRVRLEAGGSMGVRWREVYGMSTYQE
ncbi:hypothetical protein TIFTF001_049304 [Ficus carica]|uniref:Uncharacterized protein n=1 Tax=Ficus carica TaxID=3494 RepID=A0AA87ZHN1_FICCA|nr:hypothetical protein TIFTF001_049303 [Ficus carica]GMN26568.1 hypothetical protein TIFTF001_049304 [Ficus carica]